MLNEFFVEKDMTGAIGISSLAVTYGLGALGLHEVAQNTSVPEE